MDSTRVDISHLLTDLLVVCCAVAPPLIPAKGGWGSKKEAVSKPAKRIAAPKITQAKQAKQAKLRKEMEDDIAQERKQKLMHDASKPPRLPAPTRTQAKVAGVFKRPSTDQTTTVVKKKAWRDETPRSPEVTIVTEAEHFVSPMMGESTNVVYDAPVTTKEAQEIQSSEVQQCKLFITALSFELYVFSLVVDLGDLTFLCCRYVLGLNQALKDVFAKEPSILTKPIKDCMDWKEVHHIHSPYPS